jgi:hypothetical protein
MYTKLNNGWYGICYLILCVCMSHDYGFVVASCWWWIQTLMSLPWCSGELWVQWRSLWGDEKRWPRLPLLRRLSGQRRLLHQLQSPLQRYTLELGMYERLLKKVNLGQFIPYWNQMRRQLEGKVECGIWVLVVHFPFGLQKCISFTVVYTTMNL